MIKETSECTVRVPSKIENTMYKLAKVNSILKPPMSHVLKPACFSTDRDFLSVFTSYSSDLTFVTLKGKS